MSNTDKADPATDNVLVELERLEPIRRAALAIGNKVLIDRVKVALTVQLGSTEISVKDLRLLRQGQVIVLDQIIGEPLIIFANGQPLAFGEVVATDKDQYGIRITGLMEEPDFVDDDSV